jgi:hypothetical protein
MAEMLKRQHNLAVLKVSLDTTRPEARVTCELQVTVDHQPLSRGRWELSTEEMGLPARFEWPASQTTRNFRLPDDAIAEVRRFLQEELKPNVPLWLHLVKPYGYLGLFPWEKVLQPLLGVAILRLPDVLSQPSKETPTALDVILCASAPKAETSFELEHHLDLMVRRIREAVPHRRVRFDVFTDVKCVQPLTERLRSSGAWNDVRIHDPYAAESYAAPRRSSEIPVTEELVSPWLLWMRNAIEKRSVDVVHFLCHGYMTAEQGALAFAESPALNRDAHWSRFIGTVELNVFLTQIGAWSVAFTSPEHNYSDLGLRFFADTLAQRRPGPTLYHDWEQDQDACALRRAYEFLYRSEPGQPPASPGYFLYCEPSRVASPDQNSAEFAISLGALLGIEALPVSTYVEDPDSEAQLASVFRDSENVPCWLAATERYVEQCNWRLDQLGRDKSAQSRRQREESEGVKHALRQIRKAAARMSRLSRTEDEQ